MTHANARLDAFSPGSPETEIDRRNKVLVMPPGRRGMIAYVMLTNDRILFGRQLFVNPGGAGLLDLVVERQIQKQYDAASFTATRHANACETPQQAQDDHP